MLQFMQRRARASGVPLDILEHLPPKKPFHMRPSGQSRPWPLHRACSNNINGDAGLEKIEGRRRRGWQRIRWLDGITDSKDMNLSIEKVVMVWIEVQASPNNALSQSLIRSKALTLLNSVKAKRGEKTVQEKLKALPHSRSLLLPGRER